MTDLLAPDTARAQVLQQVQSLDSVRVPLVDALGMTLAEDLVSERAIPGFDNSAMDGFAVRSQDTSGAPNELELVGESRAGAPAGLALAAGQAIRISTGAMVPDGADAVVRVEDTTEHDGRIAIEVEVQAGKDLRRADDDVRAGEEVISAGTLLGPAELAVAASVGAAELVCSRRPTVATIATGDELVEPGTPLAPGQIVNSNAIAIPALVRQANCEVASVDTVGDDFEATVETIRKALAADVVVLTGGVSVGPHDHVKPALAQLAVEQIFWRVALRPGNPTWFGVAPSGTLVFGLPGNPVSAIVTFHLFVAPALAALVGRDPDARRTTAIFDDEYAKRPGRAHVLRCTIEALEDGLHARPTKQQGSHVLTSMLGVDAFAYLEVERDDVKAGERVEIELYP